MANETILVVDADAKSQKVLEVSFKKTGYRVTMVSSQREAIVSLSAQTPDLIIADTKLPDGDGFLFCEQLKQNPRYKDIPLMFLTEEDDLSKKMQAFELGAADYLTKPIFIKEVTSRVETLLHRRAKDMINVEDGEQVEGSLEEVTMIDLLQTIESDNRSGTIHLERHGSLASVHFKDGDLVDAICGKLHGEEAIYRLMLWPSGTFTIRYHEQGRRADHIEKDATALLIEGIQRLERWTEMAATLPSLQRIFEADYEKLPSILRDLPKEVGQVVRLFDGYRTLRDVIDNSPVDDLLTLRIVRKLLDDSSLNDVTPEDLDAQEDGEQANIASWLAEQTRAQKAVVTPPQPEPAPALSVRPDRALFTTAHGQQQIPSLNNSPELDESHPAPATPEPAPEAAVVPTAEPAITVEVAQPEVEGQDYEEGQAPDVADKNWRFHWDSTTQKAIAIPRDSAMKGASEEDPFALGDLARDLEDMERKRQEEEARRIAADRQAAEIASGLVASVAEQVSAQHQEEAPAPAAGFDDDDEEYVSKDDTKELHRNAILAELEQRKRQEEARERTPTPLAIPVQPSEQTERPKDKDSFDPLADVEDLLPPHARRAAAIESKATVKQEAMASLRASDEEDDKDAEEEESWRPERQRTDQFITVSRDPEEELVPLGSPADSQSEPEVSEDDVARITQQGDGDEYTLEEISSPSMVTKAHTSQDDVLEDEEDEDEEDEELALALAETPLQPLSVSLDKPTEDELEDDEEEDEEDDEFEDEEEDEDELEEEDEKTPASKLTQRTAHNRELVHTEYDLKSDPNSPTPEPEDKEDVKAPAAVDASEDEAQEEEDEEEDTLDHKREADAAAVKAEDTKEKTPAPKAETPKEEPKAAAAEPLVDRFEDLEPAPEDAFNMKGLVIVAGVIIAAVLAIFAFIKSQNTEEPVTPPVVVSKPDAGAIAAKTPDLGKAPEPVQAPDMMANKPSDMAIAADMGLAKSSDMAATTDMSKLAANPGADMAGAVATADMGKPDLGQGGASTDNGAKPDDKPVEPTQKPEETFAQKLSSAETMVKRERFSQARKVLRELAKAEPNNGQVAALLGSCEYNMGNDDAALRELNRAQRAGYRSEALFLDLASVYTAKQNNAKAIDAYNQFLKAYPNSSRAAKVRGYRDNLK